MISQKSTLQECCHIINEIIAVGLIIWIFSIILSFVIITISSFFLTSYAQPLTNLGFMLLFFLYAMILVLSWQIGYYLVKVKWLKESDRPEHKSPQPLQYAKTIHSLSQSHNKVRLETGVDCEMGGENRVDGEMDRGNGVEMLPTDPLDDFSNDILSPFNQDIEPKYGIYLYYKARQITKELFRKLDESPRRDTHPQMSMGYPLSTSTPKPHILSSSSFDSFQKKMIDCKSQSLLSEDPSYEQTNNIKPLYPRHDDQHHHQQLYRICHHESCYQIKPPRSHHCSRCTTCHLQFDHHCIFLNSCITYHNKRSFWLFLAYLCIGLYSAFILDSTQILESYTLTLFTLYLDDAPVLDFMGGEDIQLGRSIIKATAVPCYNYLQLLFPLLYVIATMLTCLFIFLTVLWFKYNLTTIEWLIIMANWWTWNWNLISQADKLKKDLKMMKMKSSQIDSNTPSESDNNFYLNKTTSTLSPPHSTIDINLIATQITQLNNNNHYINPLFLQQYPYNNGMVLNMYQFFGSWLLPSYDILLLSLHHIITAIVQHHQIDIILSGDEEETEFLKLRDETVKSWTDYHYKHPYTGGNNSSLSHIPVLYSHSHAMSLSPTQSTPLGTFPAEKMHDQLNHENEDDAKLNVDLEISHPNRTLHQNKDRSQRNSSDEDESDGTSGSSDDSTESDDDYDDDYDEIDSSRRFLGNIQQKQSHKDDNHHTNQKVNWRVIPTRILTVSFDDFDIFLQSFQNVDSSNSNPMNLISTQTRQEYNIPTRTISLTPGNTTIPFSCQDMIDMDKKYAGHYTYLNQFSSLMLELHRNIMLVKDDFFVDD